MEAYGPDFDLFVERRNAAKLAAGYIDQGLLGYALIVMLRSVEKQARMSGINCPYNSLNFLS